LSGLFAASKATGIADGLLASYWDFELQHNPGVWPDLVGLVYKAAVQLLDRKE